MPTKSKKKNTATKKSKPSIKTPSKQPRSPPKKRTTITTTKTEPSPSKFNPKVPVKIIAKPVRLRPDRKFTAGTIMLSIAMILLIGGLILFAAAFNSGIMVGDIYLFELGAYISLIGFVLLFLWYFLLPVFV